MMDEDGDDYGLDVGCNVDDHNDDDDCDYFNDDNS